MMQWYQYIRYG